MFHCSAPNSAIFIWSFRIPKSFRGGIALSNIAVRAIVAAVAKMSKSGRRGEISRRRISGDAFHVFSLNYGLLKMLRTRGILRRFYAFRFQRSPSWAPYRNPPRSCKQKFARYGCGAHVFLSPAFGPNSALFGNLPSAISKPLPAKFGMGSFISCENFRFCAVVFCVLGDSDFLKFLYASSGKFRPAFFFARLKFL